jgi:hypothetical protein
LRKKTVRCDCFRRRVRVDDGSRRASLATRTKNREITFVVSLFFFLFQKERDLNDIRPSRVSSPWRRREGHIIRLLAGLCVALLQVSLLGPKTKSIAKAMLFVLSNPKD